MTLLVKDRIKETTTVTGTGNCTLAGAVPQYQPVSIIGNNNTFPYAIIGQGNTEWEVGVGTYLTSGNQFVRTTVLASSNAGAAVPFSAGTKDVICCSAASLAVLQGGPLGTPLSGNLVNCTGVVAAQPKQLQSISATVSAGAITITLQPTTLDFRSTVLNDGAPLTRASVVTISLTIPSGASLGETTPNARIAVLAIDNAGTIELAVANIENSQLDETNKINTVALSAASDSMGIAYSTIARTGLMYRIVGFIDVAGSAGVWSSIALVQGAGGNSVAALGSFGYGQTWQAVTRINATVYYNTTGRPIECKVSTGNAALTIFVNEISIFTLANSGFTQSFTVPAGASYRVNCTTIAPFSELR